MITPTVGFALVTGLVCAAVGTWFILLRPKMKKPDGSSPRRGSSAQGKFYAHTDTHKDMVVCNAPKKIDPNAAAPVAAGPQRIASPAATSPQKISTSGSRSTPDSRKSATEASGYYHFSSSGKKLANKWDSFDADAECAKIDGDTGPEVVD
jgi:hypothetical protein